MMCGRFCQAAWHVFLFQLLKVAKNSKIKRPARLRLRRQVVPHLPPSIYVPFVDEQQSVRIHRENGGTLGMVPLIINPIYILYSGYLLGISLWKASWGGSSTGTDVTSTVSCFPCIRLYPTGWRNNNQTKSPSCFKENLGWDIFYPNELY